MHPLISLLSRSLSLHMCLCGQLVKVEAQPEAHFSARWAHTDGLVAKASHVAAEQAESATSVPLAAANPYVDMLVDRVSALKRRASELPPLHDADDSSTLHDAYSKHVRRHQQAIAKLNADMWRALAERAARSQRTWSDAQKHGRFDFRLGSELPEELVKVESSDEPAPVDAAGVKKSGTVTLTTVLRQRSSRAGVSHVHVSVHLTLGRHNGLEQDVHSALFHLNVPRGASTRIALPENMRVPQAHSSVIKWSLQLEFQSLCTGEEDAAVCLLSREDGKPLLYLLQADGSITDTLPEAVPIKKLLEKEQLPDEHSKAEVDHVSCELCNGWLDRKLHVPPFGCKKCKPALLPSEPPTKAPPSLEQEAKATRRWHAMGIELHRRAWTINKPLLAQTKQRVRQVRVISAGWRRLNISNSSTGYSVSEDGREVLRSSQVLELSGSYIRLFCCNDDRQSGFLGKDCKNSSGVVDRTLTDDCRLRYGAKVRCVVLEPAEQPVYVLEAGVRLEVDKVLRERHTCSQLYLWQLILRTIVHGQHRLKASTWIMDSTWPTLWKHPLTLALFGDVQCDGKPLQLSIWDVIDDFAGIIADLASTGNAKMLLTQRTLQAAQEATACVRWSMSSMAQYFSMPLERMSVRGVNTAGDGLDFSSDSELDNITDDDDDLGQGFADLDEDAQTGVSVARKLLTGILHRVRNLQPGGLPEVLAMPLESEDESVGKTEATGKGTTRQSSSETKEGKKGRAGFIGDLLLSSSDRVIFLIISREADGMFHVEVVNTDPDSRRFHAQAPNRNEIFYSSSLQLRGVPPERMLFEAWWLLLLHVWGEPTMLYSKLLPWLIQAPLQTCHARRGLEDDLDSGGGRAHWLSQRDGDGFVMALLEAVRQIMLCMLPALHVDSFFLMMRSFVVSKCGDDIASLDPDVLRISSATIDTVEGIARSMAVRAAEPRKWDPRMLRLALTAVEAMRSQLQRHQQQENEMRRPTPPVLSLQPPRRLSAMHLHWHFNGFAPQNTSSLRGNLHKHCKQQVTEVLKDLTGEQMGQVARRHRDQLSLSDCLNALQQCLQLCLQAVNLRRLDWRYSLIRMNITDLFARLLPLPVRSPSCVWWKSSGDPVTDHSLSVEVLKSLHGLSELLAQTCRDATGREQPTWSVWYPMLVVISGTMAAIADAVVRRLGDVRADASKRPPFALLLCGDEQSVVTGQERAYGISATEFEERTRFLSMPLSQLMLMRMAVLDYFHQCHVPANNHLFNFEDPEFLSTPEACATARFLASLEDVTYNRAQVSDGQYKSWLESGRLQLLHPAVAEYASVMLYWRIFTLTSDSDTPLNPNIFYKTSEFNSSRKHNPFHMPSIPELPEFARLIRYYIVTSHNQQQTTATFQANRSVHSEDDVLHMHRLPNYGGRLDAPDSELLLQYLTVPYLRIPLLLDFFCSDAHLHALLDPKLRKLLELVLFESTEYVQTPPLTTQVPSNSHVPRFGYLFNELVYAGAQLVERVHKLIDLAMNYDARNAADPMASVILFLTQTSVRIEQASSYLLSAQAELGLALLEPEALHDALAKLRALFRGSLAETLFGWLGSLPARGMKIEFDIRSHLVLLHSTAEHMQADTVSAMLCNLMAVLAYKHRTAELGVEGDQPAAANSSSKDDMAVPVEMLLFSWTRLRLRVFDYLQGLARQHEKLSNILDSVYAASASTTSTAGDTRIQWACLLAKDAITRRVGRYVGLDAVAASKLAALQTQGRVPAIDEDSRIIRLELNLQALQVVSGTTQQTAVALPEDVAKDPHVMAALQLDRRNSQQLQGELTEEYDHMKCFAVSATTGEYHLECWSENRALEKLTELNDSKMLLNESNKTKVNELCLRTVGGMPFISLERRASKRIWQRNQRERMKEHERWVHDLMNGVPSIFWECEEQHIVKDQGEHQNIHTSIDFYMPTAIPRESDVVLLLGAKVRTRIFWESFYKLSKTEQQRRRKIEEKKLHRRWRQQWLPFDSLWITLYDGQRTWDEGVQLGEEWQEHGNTVELSYFSWNDAVPQKGTFEKSSIAKISATERAKLQIASGRPTVGICVAVLRQMRSKLLSQINVYNVPAGTPEQAVRGVFESRFEVVSVESCPLDGHATTQALPAVDTFMSMSAVGLPAVGTLPSPSAALALASGPLGAVLPTPQPLQPSLQGPVVMKAQTLPPATPANTSPAGPSNHPGISSTPVASTATDETCTLPVCFCVTFKSPADAKAAAEAYSGAKVGGITVALQQPHDNPPSGPRPDDLCYYFKDYGIIVYDRLSNNTGNTVEDHFRICFADGGELNDALPTPGAYHARLSHIYCACVLV